jgi:hypothetical protein
VHFISQGGGSQQMTSAASRTATAAPAANSLHAQHVVRGCTITVCHPAHCAAAPKLQTEQANWCFYVHEYYRSRKAGYYTLLHRSSIYVPPKKSTQASSHQHALRMQKRSLLHTLRRHQLAAAAVLLLLRNARTSVTAV